MRNLVPLALIACVAGGTFATAEEIRDRAFIQAMNACTDANILANRDTVQAALTSAPAGAAAEAERMMEEGLAACGNGDLEAGRAQLNDAVEVLATFSTATSEAAPEPEAAAGPADAEEAPWWQFW